MLTKKIRFKNFKGKIYNKKILNDLKALLKEKNTVLESLSKSYKYSYGKKIVSKPSLLVLVLNNVN